MKRVHVVAAVIESGEDILIARRPDHVHQGGKWEFPGGKVEPNESLETALARELHEELGIHVVAAQPLIAIAHDYPDKQVLLDVWRVTEFTGDPVGREGQQVQWVARADLRQYEFPAANVPIVAAVQLPSVYVISPDIKNLPIFLNELKSTVIAGNRLIQIRINAISPEEWNTLLNQLERLRHQHNARFLLNSANRNAAVMSGGNTLPSVFDGIHLTSADLMRLKQRPVDCRWLAASCHSLTELEQAAAMGVDFATLSPVQPTQSHPEAIGIGWESFAELAQQARLPVYGLGGLSAADIPVAQSAGGQGVAGIRGFWHFSNEQ